MSPAVFRKMRVPGMDMVVLVRAPSSCGTSSNTSRNAGKTQAAPCIQQSSSGPPNRIYPLDKPVTVQLMDSLNNIAVISATSTWR